MQFDYTQQPGLRQWNRNVVKTETPLVSIVTPYFNGEQHIRQTCCSVLNQTFPYFEWILVNDGSTGKADLEVLEEIRNLDPRIRILHKDNGGISTARNFGIRHARTELILPLDADDLLEPTFIEYCWWMLQKNPGAAWAYTDSVGFQGQEYLWRRDFDPIGMKQENLLTATALIRKSALEAIGGYYEGAKHFNEDWHVWLRMIARGGYPVQCTEEYLFWYRRTDSGVLSKVRTDKAVARENRELIRSAGEQIREPHVPVRYPGTFSYNWERPAPSSWDKCIYPRKEKKHILFLLPHMEMGGADKFNLDLMTGLDPEAYDMGIITTIRNTQSWQQKFRKVTPHIFNLANFADPRDYAEFISYYIRSRKVDILFLSNSYLGYYLTPWLRETFPELVIVDYVHMEEWYWRRGGYARTSAMLGPVTEKTYVCNSATRAVMLQHFGREADTVETVHIGVDDRYFDRETVPPGTLYRELGIPGERPVVLFICRLHPQKRPFMMLEIAKRVKEQIPGVVVAVVGDGPQEKDLRRKARSMGLGDTVCFLGAKKDVRPYCRDAKVTLVCSLKEGLSLTAYESCAMGVPVVSGDVGGQRDLVDETVGALIPCLQEEETSLDSRSFPREEIEGFAEAIVQLLTDSRRWEEASRNCREKICRSFTIGNMVAHFENEFRYLTEDPALAARRRNLAQHLQELQPLAGELYTAQMQLQSMESLPEQKPEENLLQRILRVYREEGISGIADRCMGRLMRLLRK